MDGEADRDVYVWTTYPPTKRSSRPLMRFSRSAIATGVLGVHLILTRFEDRFDLATLKDIEVNFPKLSQDDEFARQSSVVQQ